MTPARRIAGVLILAALVAAARLWDDPAGSRGGVVGARIAPPEGAMPAPELGWLSTRTTPGRPPANPFAEPARIAAGAATPAAAPRARAVPELHLHGVFIAGALRSALIREGVGAAPRWVALGERIGSGTLVAVGQDHAALEVAGIRRVLPLRRGAASPEATGESP